MTPAQIGVLIAYCHQLDPRGPAPTGDQLTLAITAWASELPVAITGEEARQAAHRLARNNHRITPAAIGRLYDADRTPLHQQGITTSPRPGDPPRPAISATIDPYADPDHVLTGPETSALITELGLIRGRTTTNPAMSNECPVTYCRARPNQQCVNGTGRRKTTPHPSRSEGATQ